METPDELNRLQLENLRLSKTNAEISERLLEVSKLYRSTLEEIEAGEALTARVLAMVNKRLSGASLNAWEVVEIQEELEARRQLLLEIRRGQVQPI